MTAALSLTSNSAAGLVARYSGTGDQNMYWGAISNTNGQNTAYIFRNVAGAWSALTMSTTLIGTLAPIQSTGPLRFEVFGTSLKLFLNNSLVAVANDGMLTAAGSVGIRSDVGATLDNFSVLPHLASATASLTFATTSRRATMTAPPTR